MGGGLQIGARVLFVPVEHGEPGAAMEPARVIAMDRDQWIIVPLRPAFHALQLEHPHFSARKGLTLRRRARQLKLDRGKDGE